MSEYKYAYSNETNNYSYNASNENNRTENSNGFDNNAYYENTIKAICPQCRNTIEIVPGTKFCEKCGCNLLSDNINTGYEESQYYTAPIPNEKYYTAPIPNENYYYQEEYNLHGKNRKSKLAAWLLCYMLGWMGGHWFYLGKSGKGLLYLFTIGLFGFGWIIDLFTLPFRNDIYL